LVKCNEQHWVIPTHAVSHVWIISPEEIINLEGTQAVIFDKRPVILSNLSNILGFSKNEALKTKQLPLIVLEKAGSAVALLVDEILGEREIVLKPLTHPLTYLPCVSGG